MSTKAVTMAATTVANRTAGWRRSEEFVMPDLFASAGFLPSGRHKISANQNLRHNRDVRSWVGGTGGNPGGLAATSGPDG
jgi:hypothetical protein